MKLLNLYCRLKRILMLARLHFTPVRPRILKGLAAGVDTALDFQSAYRVSPGVFYAAVFQMEREGLVTSARLVDGRTRYLLTPAGQRAAEPATKLDCDLIELLILQRWS
ncbi:MarR family transcriptional regulator [Deinococcus sp. 12RED42]|uniref:MarR family transcriptional regulator n=1 Tax=Deinococcus sp. 12RED42 TaxID=2745872 RepID=UPI001E4519E9|nr:MarR family transcriptional regulator [Deinococcus sp. 12RED42]MCD0167629.1 helix-turn-helix transcriptional regulator [Deinococcus sp. 12RED42]